MNTQLVWWRWPEIDLLGYQKIRTIFEPDFRFTDDLFKEEYFNTLRSFESRDTVSGDISSVKFGDSIWVAIRK